MPARARRPSRHVRAPDPRALPGARRGPWPASLEVERARLVRAIPTGDEWLHETKFDGYRMACFVRGRRARLVSRNGKEWSDRFGPVVRAAAALEVETLVLDGEVVALDDRGRSSFQTLQNMLAEASGEPVYYAFDVVYWNGWDLRAVPLLDRKRLLAQLPGLEHRPRGILRYSDHIQGHGDVVYREACRHGLEGVVSKLATSTYTGSRSGSWTKFKCTNRQEFVIGGFTEPRGTRQGLGALLLGVREDGRLRYSGRVGTGFSGARLVALARRLRKIERVQSPFAGPVPAAGSDRIHWTRPAVVAEVEFTEWTADGLLRHPSFQGLREDKAAKDVVREQPEAAPRGAIRSPSGTVRPTLPRATVRAGAVSVADVVISHPTRVLDASSGITKLEFARYFEAIAEHMLPELANRPLMLVRCPGGVGSPCFHQKHSNGRAPVPRRRATASREDGGLVIRDLHELIQCVQMGAIEFHVWGSRADQIERPDRLVFDLDPGPGVSWADVARTARAMRVRLQNFDLESFARTTGGKGLHVVVPIRPRQNWDEIKRFCHGIAMSFVRDDPDHYTARLSKERRRGRIFIDYLRNGRGATAVASYSPRARAGLPVATPIAWSDLARPPDTRGFDVASTPRRLAHLRRNPWAGFATLRQTLTKAALREAGAGGFAREATKGVSAEA